MRLIACRLRQVRLHRDLELQFGRQLTLIGGPNETGKSTLVEALHKALFLRATASGRGVEELRSRLHAGLPEVELRFAAAGQTWLLRKRFAGSSGTCQLSDERGTALNGAAAEEQLAQLLGFDAPVEGRRIAQLPERWAHLWVRQGESGSNPIGGGQERYDYGRLVDQLQSRGSSEALESLLDRQVMERIQQRTATLYTATGRVKAGSPLAEAQRREAEAAARLEQARQRVSDLEEAMEQWQRSTTRLSWIEQQQRPALQLQQQQRRQRQLLLAELEPLRQQRQQLLQWQQEQEQIKAQLLREQQEQQQLQRQLEEQLQQLQLLQHQGQQGRQQQLLLQEQRRQLQTQQDLAQLLLDQLVLQGERQQLLEHQRHLQQLQSEAEQLKGQLAALPEIQSEQVRQLRQAEQDLAKAEARCQAMAASLSVIRSDQTIQLNGDPLQAGEQRLLSGSSELQIGTGVVLQLQPGGGQALPQAQAERDRCAQELNQWLRQLQVENSDSAEQIERQRRQLDSELTNLRKAARAIPWSGLQERLEALTAREARLQQQLSQQSAQLEALAADPDSPDPQGLDRSGLEDWLEQLRSRAAALDSRLSQHEQDQQQREHRTQQAQADQQASRSRQAQLEGSLAVLSERLPSAADQAQRLQQLQALEARLAAGEQQLQQLQAEPGSGPADADLEGALQALEQEKDQLLSQRGQAEQLCRSLGAGNPLAELEQCQASWEDCRDALQRQEQQGQALLLLQDRFHQAQADLANRYSEPLREAIVPYLQDLDADPQLPLLDFDPQQGFHNLQLRQGNEAYGFERLSGGRREQLGAALRLAMADVLMPAYDGSLPLVFDDAFTNSDRQRLSGLQRMLGRGMQQGAQIVLLTCHPEDYDTSLLQTQKNPPDASGGMEVIQVQLG